MKLKNKSMIMKSKHFNRIPDLAKEVPQHVKDATENYTGNPDHPHPSGTW